MDHPPPYLYGNGHSIEGNLIESPTGNSFVVLLARDGSPAAIQQTIERLDVNANGCLCSCVRVHQPPSTKYTILCVSRIPSAYYLSARLQVKMDDTVVIDVTGVCIPKHTHTHTPIIVFDTKTRDVWVSYTGKFTARSPTMKLTVLNLCEPITATNPQCMLLCAEVSMRKG